LGAETNDGEEEIDASVESEVQSGLTADSLGAGVQAPEGTALPDPRTPQLAGPDDKAQSSVTASREAEQPEQKEEQRRASDVSPAAPASRKRQEEEEVQRAAEAQRETEERRSQLDEEGGAWVAIRQWRERAIRQISSFKTYNPR
jgi:hypothetical protein